MEQTGKKPPMRMAALAVALAAMAWVALLPGDACCQRLDRKARDSVIREAQILTRSGNHDAALDRLEWLYAELPLDEVVVTALFDLLVQREKYPRAEEVMQAYLDSRETYLAGMAKLADLYFKMGQADRAGGLLERFLESARNKAWAYEMAAQAYINAGRMEQAMAVIAAGRELHANEYMLYEQAGQVYSKTGRYADAVNEYLRAVEGEVLAGDAAYGKILAVAGESDALEVVVATLEEAAAAGRAGIVPLLSLWKISMAEGDCRGGLDKLRQMIEIDETVIGLAVGAARDFESRECYGECAEAYALAAKVTRVRNDIPEYLLSKGACEEYAGNLDAAIATYRDFVRDYARWPRVFMAYLALARVLRESGRYEEAVAEADMAIQAKAPRKTASEAVLVKGDCLVMLERFDEAKLAYDMVRPDWDDMHAQAAYFNLGEIAFYEHDFDAALSYYNVAMTEYPGEMLANDAVERMILIRGTRSGDSYAPELKVLADAALLERRKMPADAVPLLRATAAAGPPEVRIESRRALIRIYLENGEYEQALEICELAGTAPETHWAPVALETAGDICMRLDKVDEAIAKYEDVIVKFPASVSAGDARRKLDLLRRDAAK